MRTGYFSRDFPNFADPPPDYIQHVHGHLPEDIGESIEADWPIWARETRPCLAVRIAKGTSARHTRAFC